MSGVSSALPFTIWSKPVPASFVVRCSIHTGDTKTYMRLRGNNRVSNAAEGGGGGEQNSTTEKQAGCVWFLVIVCLFWGGGGRRVEISPMLHPNVRRVSAAWCMHSIVWAPKIEPLRLFQSWYDPSGI